MADSAPPSRLQRASSLSLVDGSSALFGALSTRLQGKKGSSAPPPPPHPSLSSTGRVRAPSMAVAGHRHRRKPMVVVYRSTSEPGDPPVLLDIESSASFDVESAMAQYAASFDPQSSMTQSSSMHQPRGSSTLRRMSMRLSSLKPRGEPKAEARARKYDVDWQDDRSAPCCQSCFALFSTLHRRRHHCRVCGELVCGECSLDVVALPDKGFASPKRACAACVTLLEAMALERDPRVAIDHRQHKYPNEDDHQVSTGSTGSTASALPTPRYRDRLAEVRRVMAAGKKSQRRSGGLMCVLPTAWLQQWLAFTSVDHGDRSAASSNEASAAASPPPGPIDTWGLLEFDKGRLVQRPGLVRDDQADPQHSTGRGDYQLVTPEVFEVLKRLYGGGPTVRVDVSASAEWMVDVAALLATAQRSGRVAVSPTVERSLCQRHYRGDAAKLAAAMTALPSTPTTPLPPTKPRGESGESSGSTTMSEEETVAAVEPLVPVRLAASGSNAMTMAELPPASPAARAEAPSPTAATATAASAFALAMKQARLNAQRAIDERARVA